MPDKNRSHRQDKHREGYDRDIHGVPLLPLYNATLCWKQIIRADGLCEESGSDTSMRGNDNRC